MAGGAECGSWSWSCLPQLELELLVLAGSASVARLQMSQELKQRRWSERDRGVTPRELEQLGGLDRVVVAEVVRIASGG